MDSSLSHDPFKGDTEVLFPFSKYRQAGAKDEEIEQLYKEYLSMDDDEKNALLGYLEDIDLGDLKYDVQTARQNGEFEKGKKMFPIERFLAAGASNVEIEQLEADFKNKSPQDQDAYLDMLASKSRYDLTELLNEFRASNQISDTLGSPEPQAELSHSVNASSVSAESTENSPMVQEPKNSDDEGVVSDDEKEETEPETTEDKAEPDEDSSYNPMDNSGNAPTEQPGLGSAE